MVIPYYFYVGNEWPWNSQNQFTLSLTEIPFVNAGSATNLDICYGSDIDLSTTVTGQEFGGVYSDLDNTNHLTDSLLTTVGLASIPFNFSYSVGNTCHNDTAAFTVTVHDLSNAGADGTLSDNCDTHLPIDLLSGLTGAVDLGGTWANNSGEGTVTGKPMES